MDYEKMLCYNEDIHSVFHDNIVEYDMKAASVSVCERFKLLPQTKIDQLKLLPKDVRTKEMGLMQRDNQIFSNNLLSGIRDIRQKFLKENNLDDSNILSLHSDAILFVSKKEIVDEIEGVKFVNKGNWTNYIRYDKTEMFYKDRQIDYKGISHQSLEIHAIGMNKFFIDLFDKIDNYDDSVIRYITRFQSQYLTDKLPPYYYHTFGSATNYKFGNLKLLGYIAQIVSTEVKKW